VCVCVWSLQTAARFANILLTH